MPTASFRPFRGRGIQDACTEANSLRVAELARSAPIYLQPLPRFKGDLERIAWIPAFAGKTDVRGEALPRPLILSLSKEAGGTMADAQ